MHPEARPVPVGPAAEELDAEEVEHLRVHRQVGVDIAFDPVDAPELRPAPGRRHVVFAGVVVGGQAEREQRQEDKDEEHGEEERKFE